METSVEIFAIVHLALMGASHAFRPRVWAELFICLSEKGRIGVLFHSFLSIWFGSIVVAFHNVWVGIPAALTAFAWLVLLKAALGFVFPDVALKSLQKVSLQGGWKFVPVGVVYLVLAAALAYHVWGRR